MDSKFIPMLKQAGEYKDLICPQLRTLLGFLEEPKYCIVARILTGKEISTSQEATEALVHSKVVEKYVGISSIELYQSDAAFKVLIDSLAESDLLRSRVIPDLLDS